MIRHLGFHLRRHNQAFERQGRSLRRGLYIDSQKTLVDARPPFRQLRHQCGQSSQRPVDSLFRRFTVEVFVVRFRVGAGMVDNAVPMIRRCIERIELQWNTAGIDDVVIRPSRDEHGEARADRRVNAIENGLARPFLHAKELIELVHFHPDLLLGLQRHDHELTVLSRVKHLAKIIHS